MTLDETVKHVKAFARKHKVDCVSSPSPDFEDMNSFLMFQRGSEFVFVQGKLDGNPVVNLPVVLERSFREGIRRFDSVSFVSDVYLKGVPLSEFERVKDEVLSLDFESELANNPFTDVVEAVCCFTFSWTGESRVSVSQYVKGDDGLPVYVDDDVSSGEFLHEQTEVIGGTVREILESFVNKCKVSPSQDYPF